MSWFSEILSGGAGARQAAMSRAGQQAISDFRALGKEYSTLFGPIMEQMSRDRAANIGLYREQMGRAQADYTRYFEQARTCLLYTSPSPRDRQKSRMPSSA